MDIKHKHMYMQLKLPGVALPIVVNEGKSLLALLSQAMQEANKAPNRYDSDIEIRISAQPIADITLSAEDLILQKLRADGFITMETPEEAELAINNPGNPNGNCYDPLYAQWQQCGVTSTRLTKLPSELDMLRKHVHSKYLGTPYYEGVTRW